MSKRSSETGHRDSSAGSSRRMTQKPEIKLARDINRMVRAWNEANAEMWVGSLKILSYFIVNTSDPDAASGGRKDSSPRGLVEDYSQTIVNTGRTYSRAMNDSFRVIRRFYEDLSEIYDL